MSDTKPHRLPASDPALATWLVERARKPDVQAALRCIQSGRDTSGSDLAAIGYAWLYRQGMVWAYQGGKAELTESGKILAAHVVARKG